eukprot:Awhi_evm1s2924
MVFIENPADEILPGIWLGNHLSSQDAVFLQKNKITLIVNATPDYPNHFDTDIDIKYIRIPIQNRDKPEYRQVFEDHLHQTVEELRANWKAGNGCLVHCKSGHTRSATIIAVFLAAHNEQKLSLHQAREKIQAKRPTALRTHPFFFPPLQPLGGWRRKSQREAPSRVKAPANTN